MKIADKCVYIMENLEFGLVKIGISGNVKRRLETVMSSCGVNVSLYYYTMPITNSRDIEKEMHRIFQRSRAKGEWFKITKEEAKDALDRLMEGFDYSDFIKMVKDRKSVAHISESLGLSRQHVHKLMVNYGIRENIKIKEEKKVIPKKPVKDKKAERDVMASKRIAKNTYRRKDGSIFYAQLLEEWEYLA